MIEQNQQSMAETNTLSITPAAADKVRELLEQENDPSPITFVPRSLPRPPIY